MKGRSVFLIILFIVLADQLLKVYVKTHYHSGEWHPVIGEWFQLYFIENEGMAYGWKFGGEWGKIVLTLFRLAAVIFGVFYIKRIVQQKYHRGFVLCAALIFSGALGNLIDSIFYGLIFENSSPVFRNVAKIFPARGYAGLLHGKVVDMLHFPIITDARYPSWFPFWGGEDFVFFRPIFNLADASISTGVIAILLFQKRFLGNKSQELAPRAAETHQIVDDEIQVSQN